MAMGPMERQYMNLAATAIVAFGGFVAVLFAARFQYYSDVVMAIFFSGSVGAVVNNYFRLSKIASRAKALETDLTRPNITLQIWVSLFLSGILGFVAYGLFLSGMLQGELFPRFNGLDGEYKDLTQLLRMVLPKTNLDAAKALIWAFVAGFSERFVPNVLDSLVLKAETLAKDA